MRRLDGGRFMRPCERASVRLAAWPLARHGKTTGHRRVAREGENARSLPRATATASRRATATSAICPSRPPKSRRRSRRRTGAASASTSTSDFTPYYVVPADKKKQVAHLKTAIKDASELLLATDPDREGESISWHLTQVLKPKVPVRRIVFHEITEDAVSEALEHPATSNENLVRAQESRRILDRLYGYTLSPVLWKKVQTGLSAGRVQSVAVRLIVEREEERRAFRTGVYWDLEAQAARRGPRVRRDARAHRRPAHRDRQGLRRADRRR